MNTIETYYSRNRELILQKRKEYYQKKKEKLYAQHIEWRKANPERMMEYRKTWQKRHPSWDMYHNAKRRAKDFGVPFDITFRDIDIPTHCPVLGIELISGRGTKKSSDNSPSLDRIIPEKGYVVGNICVISSRANRFKQEMTVEDLRKVLTYIEDRS